MQAAQGTPILDPSAAPPAARRPHRRLVGGALAVLVVLALLAVLPPFLSLTRYQRRVTGSMSQILGRPVHLDRITLNLLPFPSFTMQNLVIDEVSPFGSEPLLRSATVDARLRLLPLWRHRVEFSRITFHDPSVNLVRNPADAHHWNLESILLQAAHIDAAPTSGAPGPSAYTPRFPYIEATNARVNLKLGLEKTPFSVTEADFALWLPEPREWRMRLRAHPTRTDTNSSDTGTLQIEATLQRARTMDTIPVDLDLTWTGAPLGEASLVLAGTDAGLRGGLRVDAHVHGTLADAPVTTSVHLENLHRSDFVPEHAIDVDLRCSGRLTRVLHSAEDLHCRWPIADSSGLVSFAGTLPDLLSPASAQLTLVATAIPANTLLNWLRVASNRVSPTLTAAGQLTAVAALNAPLPEMPVAAGADPGIRPGSEVVGTQALRPAAERVVDPTSAAPFTAELSIPSLTLSGGRLGTVPVRTGAIGLSAVSSASPLHRPLAESALRLSLSPVALDLGEDGAPRSARDGSGSQDDPDRATNTALPLSPGSPGTATLQGSSDADGYTFRVSGPVSLPRLLALGTVLPQFGDGLADALTDLLPARHVDSLTRVDLSAHRTWGGPQVWSGASGAPTVAPGPGSPHHHR